MPFGRVGFGCDSLSSAVLQIKSQEPSLLGKASPCLILLARSFQELTSAAPSSNPSRARRTARLFLPLSLQSQTRQRKLLVSGHAIPSFARASVLRLRTSLSGLPDSHVPTLLPSVPLFRRSASGGVTVITRSNLIPSATCRGLRPCLLAISVPPASRLSPSSLRSRNRRARPF